MTMLKKLPEEVLNLWNNWEIRGMVLLSLLLQTILIIFGSRRKTNARSWIRMLVWSAYLSADVVATVALGNLARSQGDSSGDSSENANNSIQAFWAPFLLLHLGGPDTITAYSIEDNELWLRHLLGLVFQVGVAFYVFSRSWGSGILSFIAIPMFVVGIAKYAERTWVLWSSCSKSFKNSSLSDFWESYRRTGISETPPQDHQQDYLLQAYVFSNISKFMMQDLVPGISSLIRCRELISKNKADGAFKVVEAELGLIYDMLYTKAPLIYSRAGIILRCISSLLSVTAFITFQVKIDKHDYSKTDIAITYLLFAAAVFLEFYAFLCLVLSDRTMIWLIDKGGNGLTNATYSLIRKLTRGERWSRSISQYNLKSSSIEREPPKFLEFLGINEMMRQMHVNRKDLNVGLQGLIFKHLQKKAQKIKEDLHVCDMNHRSKIIGQRGDGVLEREGLLRDYKWCTTEVEFSRSILVWHLATDICYLVDMKEADAYLNKDGSNVSTEYETSRCLSEYMMYLLVVRPNMLSKGFGDEAYQRTLRGLRDQKDHGDDYDVEVHRALLELRNSESRVYDSEEFQALWKTEKSALVGVIVLANQLLSLEPEKRWETINEVWVEMLAYAAAHCPWKEHTHQLRRGGELLTHVSLLMLHLGLTAQYEINANEYKELDLLTREEQKEYDLARYKYWTGIEATSGSSPDEELKKLEKIVADKDRELQRKNQELEHQQRMLEHKDRELQRKNQELEQLRSSLTASVPQQGIDSFPRSLAAQTDDQGIH
ncbi:hypothetical protein POPTR_015G113700v4 [Populus trichocarpa]|uniref:DUF4220 domain-containing protein n=1 Tax=Populus trichocarpa TaxID=3694 RepID=A0A3N7G3K5_POPTR|nr:uncharacterized protein LOC18110537 isoform X2 [Populus trichocarpa]RQP00906.1 hypothetical protein POPTR_015G113700v4 [Populus trichocarpa]RQP00907.1 hypothetical protein POPTR_015G113700v4 [Populus trichocarpa]|eukprot:XP_006388857.2 uncharacterized protein LOC18110537 [Populus trichocarpa]